MMAREEAIEELELLLRHWDDLENDKRCFWGYDNEAVALALSALRPVSREQVEKACGKWIIPTVIGGRAFNIPHCSVCNGVPCGTNENTKFCAHCGAPMTDEAVQMVMERMEALFGERNDD